MDMIEEDMPECLKQLGIWNLHILKKHLDEIQEARRAAFRAAMTAAGEAEHPNQSQRENPV